MTNEFWYNGRKQAELPSTKTGGNIRFFAGCGNMEVRNVRYKSLSPQFKSEFQQWHCTDFSMGSSGVCGDKSVRDTTLNLTIESLKTECKGRGTTQPLKFTYFKPVVTSIKPDGGPVVGGTEITVTGREFGEKKHSATVYVRMTNGASTDGEDGLVECKDTKHVTDKVVTCITPSGAGKARGIVVGIGNQRSDEIELFDYDVPTTDSVRPRIGSTYGDATITVTGMNFGVSGDMPKVTVGGVECCNVNRTNNTELTCQVQSGHGGPKPVIVNVLRRTSNGNVSFSYNAPKILAIVPDAAQVGTDVLLFGTDMGQYMMDKPPRDVCGAEGDDKYAVKEEALRVARTPIIEQPQREGNPSLGVATLMELPPQLLLHAAMRPPAASSEGGDTTMLLVGGNGGTCEGLALFYRDRERPAKDTALMARVSCGSTTLGTTADVFRPANNVAEAVPFSVIAKGEVKCLDGPSGGKTPMPVALKIGGGANASSLDFATEAGSALNFGRGEVTIAMWVRAISPDGKIASSSNNKEGEETEEGKEAAPRTSGVLLMRSETFWPPYFDGLTVTVHDDGDIVYRQRNTTADTVIANLQQSGRDVGWKEWRHLAFSRGAEDGLVIYVDGKKVASKKMPITDLDEGTTPWRVGDSTFEGVAEGVAVWVQDVRFYSRALDLADVVTVKSSLGAVFDGKGQFGFRTMCNSGGSDIPLLTPRVVLPAEGTKVVDATYDTVTKAAALYVNGQQLAEGIRNFKAITGLISLNSPSHTVSPPVAGLAAGSTGGHISNVEIYRSTIMQHPDTVPNVAINGVPCRFSSRVPSPMRGFRAALFGPRTSTTITVAPPAVTTVARDPCRICLTAVNVLGPLAARTAGSCNGPRSTSSRT